MRTSGDAPEGTTEVLVDVTDPEGIAGRSALPFLGGYAIEGVSERYRARLERFRALAASRAAKAASADRVSRAVEHALTAERPKTRYLVGRDARIRAALERLPDRMRDRVLARALLGE